MHFFEWSLTVGLHGDMRGINLAGFQGRKIKGFCLFVFPCQHKGTSATLESLPFYFDENIATTVSCGSLINKSEAAYYAFLSN